MLKNAIFLTLVLISIGTLFLLRYLFNIINDNGFIIIILLMFISVLIIRKKLNITFFNK